MITEIRRTAAGYITLTGLRLAGWVGGHPAQVDRGRVFAAGAVKAFREQGWEIVRFDPATEPGERPIVAQRFPE